MISGNCFWRQKNRPRWDWRDRVKWLAIWPSGRLVWWVQCGRGRHRVFDATGVPPMAETRKGEVTMKGKPVELVGPKLKAGDPAPDFTCVGAGLALISLADTAGKVR